MYDELRFTRINWANDRKPYKYKPTGIFESMDEHWAVTLGPKQLTVWGNDD
jgi:hypothetical protein